MGHSSFLKSESSFTQRNSLTKPSQKSQKITNIRADQRGAALSHNVELKKTFLLFPEGLEKIFLAFYGAIIPYILGLIFLFTYIAEYDFSKFSTLYCNQPYPLTWCIGYEILAVIIILFIVKYAITTSVGNITNTQKRAFQRPV